MRNLLQLLSKYSILLMFVALETVSLILIIRNNEYQRNAFFSSSNAVIGWNYSVYSYCAEYFHLRRENQILQEENTRLSNELALKTNECNALREGILDPGYTFAEMRKAYIPAKVINASCNKRHNYLTINKGVRDSVQKDMGVVNANGVVGIVSQTTNRFATVIPIINISMQLSCKIKRCGSIGPLVWNGKDYRYAYLNDIAKHIDIQAGDTIVTSGYTPTFPEGIMVGVVKEVSTPLSSAYHNIKVELAVDYTKLNHVKIISDKNLIEQKGLEHELMD